MLITGYGGFAGGHLAEHLAAATDWDLCGTVISAEEAAGRSGWPVAIEIVDLRDPDAVAALLQQVQPELVFHLAGQAYVPSSWRDPWATFETNVRIQLNVLEGLVALARSGHRPRLVAVTSREVYGAVPPDSLPVDETAPLAPHNPYATSKAAQDLLVGQYAASHDLDAVRLRPFNHIGPRQDPRFVAASFARQVAAIEAGLAEPVIRVGDLSPRRDFTDVRDMVRAYRLAAERAPAGAVYNLGSGRSWPIGYLLDHLVGRVRVAVRIETDPERLRPGDVAETRCNPARAWRDLGWRAEIPLERTLDDMLDEWRERCAAGAAVDYGAGERGPDCDLVPGGGGQPCRQH